MMRQKWSQCFVYSKFHSCSLANPTLTPPHKTFVTRSSALQPNQLIRWRLFSLLSSKCELCSVGKSHLLEMEYEQVVLVISWLHKPTVPVCPQYLWGCLCWSLTEPWHLSIQFNSALFRDALCDATCALRWKSEQRTPNGSVILTDCKLVQVQSSPKS